MEKFARCESLVTGSVMNQLQIISDSLKKIKGALGICHYSTGCLPDFSPHFDELIGTGLFLKPTDISWEQQESL